MSLSLDLETLRAGYRAGTLTPTAVMRDVLARIAAAGEDHVWISRRGDADLLARAAALEQRRIDDLPLYGVPFAVKDNIDVAGLPTTAGCPDFAYTPAENAAVVAALEAAGAIMVGKTNLDQFATGLVGVRSPYGIARNPFDPAIIPGGSSSGSAVAVASGLVGFALGTDTAGSGRVPAGLNNLVGLKPTRGLLSNRGLVPAARSLDCISVFALTVADAAAVTQAAQGFDPADPFSRTGAADWAAVSPARFSFALPRRDQCKFFADGAAEAAFDLAIARLTALGGEAMEIDFAPWIEAANMLYGPFVAERTASLGAFMQANPASLHPVTRAIVGAGFDIGGVALFQAQQRLAELRRQCEPVWDDAAFLLAPTIAGAPSVADVLANPVARNTDMGFYTNFTNLFDLAALAVPVGFAPNGFPYGVTLIAPAWQDGKLAAFGRLLEAAAGLPLGATGLNPPGRVDLAVFGAHLQGEPLNAQLTGLGGVFRRACRTAAQYRVVALTGRIERPGLVRVASGGAGIAGEVWSLPQAALGAFLAGIAPPLGLGHVRLDDDGMCIGFICETPPDDAADITAHGGWRAYRASRRAA